MNLRNKIPMKKISKKGSAEIKINQPNTFVLGENNTIKQANTIKKELLSLLTDSEPVKIVGENIHNIDITFIQLMVSLKNSSIKRNKPVSFNFKLTKDLNTLLEHCGFKMINDSLNR